MTEPEDAKRAASRGGAMLIAAAGIFSLIVGLLLRAAVGHQDRADWNGAVKALLTGLPLLLIAGGIAVLLWAAALTARTGRSGGDDVARPPAE